MTTATKKTTKQTETSKADDLGRRFLLDVTASGHVLIRERGEHAGAGLPVFSTDTREEAERLIVRHCRLARDRSGLYRLNHWPEDPDVIRDLDRAAALFRDSAAGDPWGAEKRAAGM